MRPILNPGEFVVGYHWGNVPQEFRSALWDAQRNYAEVIKDLRWEPRDREADWTVAYS